ncbi:hypothetical protein FACS1894211_06450 [Clostridia bacterium]|nr:hypothetical protein FACS1894211_06450 [Clostridia bacterium]
MKNKYSRVFGLLTVCLLAVVMTAGLTACGLFGGGTGGDGGNSGNSQATVKIKIEVESLDADEAGYYSYSEYSGTSGGYVAGGKSLKFDDGAEVRATTESVQTLLNAIKAELGSYELENGGTFVHADKTEVRILTYKLRPRTQAITVKNYSPNFADVKISTAYDTDKNMNAAGTMIPAASVREDGWLTVKITRKGNFGTQPKGVWIIPASYDPTVEFVTTGNLLTPYNTTCVIKEDSALWGGDPTDEDGWIFLDLMAGLSGDMVSEDGLTTTFDTSGWNCDIIIVVFCGAE